MPDCWHLYAATSQDLSQILAIDQEAFQRPWHRKLFSEELTRKDAYSYVVRIPSDDGGMEIIAYVFMRIFVNEMHIMRIAVAEGFHSHGMATRLLRQCFKLAKEKKADAVFVEVRPTNKSAIGLYRSNGFELQGTRPKYYPDSGEDALLMVKYL